MRTYEKSHPWISFQLDLRPAAPRFWMLLGEAASKCDHVAGVPLKPSIARNLHSLFLAKGALATTAIEGNTLTEEQVLRHLKGELELPKSQEYLAREIDNIIQACNQIWDDLAAGVPADLTVEEILRFNRQILAGLEADPEVAPGEIRQHDVGVGRYRGAPPEDCLNLLGRLCRWLNDPAFGEELTDETAQAILKAVLGHLYLAWIHPFADGNGRTARLVEFKLLVAAGVPSTAAHLLSNHYNQTRSRYYRELDRSSKTGGGVLAFLTYAVEGLVDQLAEQITLIRNQQWEIAWNDFVYEHFRGQHSTTSQRRRDLVLALSQRPDFLPIDTIPNLTPPLAVAYATRTRRTLIRDLNALEEAGLVKEKQGRFRANKGIILAFLPGRRSPTEDR